MVEWQDGSRSANFEVGDRTEAPLVKLCEHLPLADAYCSDGYEPYAWAPRDRHHVGKGGKVNRNEGAHSMLRDRLHRERFDASRVDRDDLRPKRMEAIPSRVDNTGL